MAKARVSPKGNIKLTLNREEAKSLRSLYHATVAGNPEDTYRGDIAAIATALDAAGVEIVSNRFVGRVTGVDR